MNDGELLQRISALVGEEHQLERDHEMTSGPTTLPARLRQIEEALDQCWDLLRQRRARREFGQDPDVAQVRPVNEVEGYLQ